MKRKSTESSCSSLMTSILLGLPQIMGHVQTGVVASMLARGLQFGSSQLGSGVIWYCACVSVAAVCASSCILSILYIFDGIKPTRSGLVLWVYGMVVTCTAHAATLMAMVLTIVQESWSCWQASCAHPAPAVLQVDVSEWRISLTREPVRKLTYLLIDNYERWLLFFGVYWCILLCLHGYHVCLVVRHYGEQDDHMDSELTNNDISPYIYVDHKNVALQQKNDNCRLSLNTEGNDQNQNQNVLIEKKNNDLLKLLQNEY